MKGRDAAAAAATAQDAALQFERGSTSLALNQPPQFSSCRFFFLRIDLEMKHEENAG